jgi:hypothetical protein
MFTSAECRMRAEQKLAQADGDSRNRKRLITAAEGWLFLASQLRRLSANLRPLKVASLYKSAHSD